jgi:hypothetical protein
MHMAKPKKFNSSRFRDLMSKKLQARGYRSVNNFVEVHGFVRNALARAMVGISRPSPENLDRWCEALECTPQERKDLYHSAGHMTPEELDEEQSAA